MEDIIIKDQFKVDDSHSKIRGFVYAYDEEGNLVFKKENMIVKSGRKFIMENGLKQEFIKCVKIGTDGNAVTPEDTLDKFPETSGPNYKTLTANNKLSKSPFSSSLSNYLTFDKLDKLFINYSEGDIERFSCKKEDGTVESTGVGLDKVNYFDCALDSNNALSVKLLIIFNDENAIEAKSLGIVVNNDTNSGDVLLSRVTFPTYHKSGTQRLTFKYYIYF